jgi:hypothetical protein
MAWIESHQAIGQHPKTIALAHQLGVSLPTAVGHLHYLWWWALDYAPDGELKRHSPSIIAHACQWRGKPERLLQALVEVVQRTVRMVCNPRPERPCMHVWGYPVATHVWGYRTGPYRTYRTIPDRRRLSPGLKS